MQALLEKPVVEAPRARCTDENGWRGTNLETGERDSVNSQRNTLSRKVFLGHEEYLGYTPD